MTAATSNAKLVWLPSYPKSGNTWMRLLLRAALTGAGSLPDLDDVGSEVIASSRELLQRATGFVASELATEEADQLRPTAIESLGACADDLVLLKAHDRFDAVALGGDRFPTQHTRAIIYLVRNPLDVAPSFAHYFDISLDQAVRAMADPRSSLGGGLRPNPDQFPQEIGSWNQHVRGWTEQRVAPVTVVRYEDLVADTARELRRVLDLLSVPTRDDVILASVESCRFGRLKEVEQLRGFSERPPNGREFFRSGRSGGYRDSLSREQARRLLSDHGEAMVAMGYSVDESVLDGMS